MNTQKVINKCLGKNKDIIPHGYFKCKKCNIITPTKYSTGNSVCNVCNGGALRGREASR